MYILPLIQRRALVLSVCFCYLQAKHAETGNTCWGIDGEKGVITDMKQLGIWDCYAVKAQTIKTAMEVGLSSFLDRFIQPVSSFRTDSHFP